jgi:Spy/CpxP family protein refolding chaperone
MRLARVLAGCAMLAALLLLSTGGVTSQEKKDTPKFKGQIPTGWGKLNLDAAQKQSIYTIQGEYKEKITKLEDEIKKLEAERFKKLVAVLKPEQKKMLTEGLTDPPESKEKGKAKEE